MYLYVPINIFRSVSLSPCFHLILSLLPNYTNPAPSGHPGHRKPKENQPNTQAKHPKNIQTCLAAFLQPSWCLLHSMQKGDSNLSLHPSLRSLACASQHHQHRPESASPTMAHFVPTSITSCTPAVVAVGAVVAVVGEVGIVVAVIVTAAVAARSVVRGTHGAFSSCTATTAAGGQP